MRLSNHQVIKVPPSARPTPARVRQALFNIWRGEIAGCRWLDLCAGSGALGAEALTRGARRVVGIDVSRQACQTIRENWQRLAGEGQAFEVLGGDVAQQLPKLRGQKFDRVYFDPPYDSQLHLRVLEILAELNLLAESGEVAVEHRGGELPIPPLLKLRDRKIYGDTALSFLCPHNREGTEPLGSGASS